MLSVKGSKKVDCGYTAKSRAVLAMVESDTIYINNVKNTH